METKQRSESLGPLILVMDDQEEVRVALGALLEAIGCRSILTANGEEAIAQFRQAHASELSFDLAILDVNVPNGLGAAYTVTELLKIDSNAKVIVASGTANESLMTHFQLHGFVAQLPKPYCIGELRAAIADFVLKK